MYLCNWERWAEGDRERCLTFLEPVLQVRCWWRWLRCVARRNDHVQVALQHNVCIVCLPSAVHVVALHNLRILQVRFGSLIASAAACVNL